MLGLLAGYAAAFGRVKRAAILGDQGVSEALITAADEQARALGLQTQRIRVAGPNPNLEAAIAQMREQHADAQLVLEERQ
jgi:ABC-type branched-subunit amino acid transport system substrate-binding protein